LKVTLQNDQNYNLRVSLPKNHDPYLTLTGGSEDPQNGEVTPDSQNQVFIDIDDEAQGRIPAFSLQVKIEGRQRVFSIGIPEFDCLPDVARRESTGDVYGSLTNAINAATGTASAPDTITLLADVTITGTSTVTIPREKHIKLIAGDTARTIRRGESGFGSLITVASGGSLELGGTVGLIIDGGSAATPPITATEALIRVEGNLTMSDSSVTLKNNNNVTNDTDPTTNGGGVCVFNGDVTMNGGTITGNTAATDGGGVYVFGSNAEFIMSGGSIFWNTADGGGGGVYVFGSNAEFTMSGGSISGNTASGGGGVFLSYGAVTMNGGTIGGGAPNTAVNGGGVSMAGGSFTMNTGSSISGNTAAYLGGGAAIVPDGGVDITFTINGGYIYANEGNPSLNNSAGSGGAALFIAMPLAYKEISSPIGWSYTYDNSTEPGSEKGSPWP
jgi:hypothetical protein